MARKRKRMIVVQPKKVEGPMVISVKPWEVSLGHPQKVCGTGVHGGKGRMRRGDCARKALAEWA